MKKIGIIGSGVSSLASAARLAKKGYEVEIFEKNEISGGRMSYLEKDGFTFDMGPTIVMMPEIYNQVFIDCEVNPEDYIPMIQIEDIYDLYFPDQKIVFPSSISKIHNLLESLQPDSADGFFQYLSVIYHRYLIARDHFITKSFNKKSDFYNPKTLIKGMQLKTFNSADNLIAKYIDNDKIRKMLAFQTLYIGISPYQGPSLYAMIPMVEMVYGVWFIKGGMKTMASSMTRLCLELGVKFHYNHEVEEILIKDKTAYGLKVNNKDYNFDLILNTSDFPYAMDELVKADQNKGKYVKSYTDKMDYSCSGYLLYLGLDIDLTDKINVHNVIFAEDFDNNIKSIFNGKFTSDQSVYVYAPSTIDKTLAPANKTGIYLLCPIADLKCTEIDWNDEKQYQEVRQAILDKVKIIPALKNIEDHIIMEERMIPLDFVSRYNAKFGAAFGLRPSLKQSNHLRPQSKSKVVKNLYFAGASNHPGAGVPIVLTSAEIVVKDILNDEK